MIGAILAGGYGKRLKPITDNIPKGLIEIKDNYTIMDRQMLDFKNSGIIDVYILSGYLSEKIEAYYKDYSGLNIHILNEEKPMGTLYSLKNLINNIDDDIVLRNGDTVSDIDLKDFIEYSKRKDFGMTMYITRMKSPYGIVEFSGDMAINFKEKPDLDYYINAGIYYIKKSVFNYFLNDYIETDIEKSAFPEIVHNNLLGIYKDDSFWMGIDSEKDLDAIKKLYTGRNDTEYGYVKELYSANGIGIKEYYIKKGYKVGIKENGILKLMEGSGYIYMGKTLKYKSGSIFTISGEIQIVPYENTKIEIINGNK